MVLPLAQHQLIQSWLELAHECKMVSFVMPENWYCTDDSAIVLTRSFHAVLSPEMEKIMPENLSFIMFVANYVSCAPTLALQDIPELLQSTCGLLLCTYKASQTVNLVGKESRLDGESTMHQSKVLSSGQPHHLLPLSDPVREQVTKSVLVLPES